MFSTKQISIAEFAYLINNSRIVRDKIRTLEHMNSYPSENSDHKEENTSEVDEKSPISPKATYLRSPTSKRVGIDGFMGSAGSNTQMLQLSPADHPGAPESLELRDAGEVEASEGLQAESINASQVAMIPRPKSSQTLPALIDSKPQKSKFGAPSRLALSKTAAEEEKALVDGRQSSTGELSTSSSKSNSRDFDLEQVIKVRHLKKILTSKDFTTSAKFRLGVTCLTLMFDIVLSWIEMFEFMDSTCLNMQANKPMFIIRYATFVLWRLLLLFSALKRLFCPTPQELTSKLHF